jgi:hypothetical protein
LCEPFNNKKCTSLCVAVPNVPLTLGLKRKLDLYKNIIGTNGTEGTEGTEGTTGTTGTEGTEPCIKVT